MNKQQLEIRDQLIKGMVDKDKLLTYEDAAEIFGVSKGTVHRARRETKSTPFYNQIKKI